MAEIASWLISGAVVTLSIAVHYQTMMIVSDRVIPWARRRMHDRRTVIAIIYCLLGGHIMEIFLFAGALMGCAYIDGFGSISGEFSGRFNDFLYFSASTYTAIGDGDIHIKGPIRELLVSETLTGLLMIAWSASFTFLKMEQIWKDSKGR